VGHYQKIASNVSHMLHRNGPVDYKIWGVMQQCVYDSKNHLWPAKTLDADLGLLWTIDIWH